MSSGRQAVISRRAKTIPTMLGATTVAFLGLPLLAPLAVVVDVVRLRLKLPTLRVYLFLLQYLFNDSVEILTAPFLWIVRAPVSVYDRIQQTSADLMVKRAEQLLGIRLEIDTDSLKAVSPGPVVVMSRHVSVFDSTLPAVLCAQAGLTTRGLIMAEMLADPGFDLIYGRLGWKFIARDDGPAALAQVGELAAGADENTALMIFPEGRVFSPSVLERSLERLKDRSPERAKRLGGLKHSLPPRPGGLIGLLAANPDSDVVLVSHAGLDEFGGLADLATRVPINSIVRISARRIPRSDIPAQAAGQIVWLDDLWLNQDAGLS